MVGVVDYCRNKSPFEPEEPEFFLYRRVCWGRVAAESQFYALPKWFLVRVQSGTPHSFEKQIRERLAPVARHIYVQFIGEMLVLTTLRGEDERTSGVSALLPDTVWHVG